MTETTDSRTLDDDPLRRVVGIMERLYSPGGCPWDREQTHRSLVPYLLEEAHELAEVIETGDRDGMREELGDVLLQVLFHARIATDEPDPFTVDDIARDLGDKLVRRHPHVFGDAPSAPSGELHAQWDALKRAEKRRDSVLDGIALDQGALARAQKVVARARRGGLADVVDGVPSAALAGTAPGTTLTPGSTPNAMPMPGTGEVTAEAVGADLLDLVRRADAAGIDAEAALRTACRALETEIVAVERSVARRSSR